MISSLSQLDKLSKEARRLGFASAPRSATCPLRPLFGRPFFCQRFEDLGRFIPNDILILGDRADQTAKDGQAAQAEIGTTVVDTHLRVHLHNRIGRAIIFYSKLAVDAACNKAKRVFVSHRGVSLSVNRLFLRLPCTLSEPLPEEEYRPHKAADKKTYSLASTSVVRARIGMGVPF